MVAIFKQPEINARERFNKLECHQHDNRYTKINDHVGRNFIINGDFSVWQRGDPITIASTSAYSSDRWNSTNNAGTTDHSQLTLTPGESELLSGSKYAMRSDVVSGTLVSSYVSVMQKIHPISKLSGKRISISFWAKADTPSQISVELAQTFGSGGTPSPSILGIGVTKFNITTEFVKYSLTVDMPGIFGKTVGTSDNDVAQLIFWLSAGSNFSDRTDGLTIQDGVFDIANVQVEESDQPTTFEVIDKTDQLIRCKNYYQVVAHGVAGIAGSTTVVVFGERLAVPMRQTPGVGIADSSFSILQSGVTIFTSSASSIINVSTSAVGYTIRADGFTGLTTNAGINLRNGITPVFTLDAEL